MDQNKQDKSELDSIAELYSKAKFMGALGVINIISALVCLFSGDISGFTALSFVAILLLVVAWLIASIASSSERFVKSIQDAEERRKKVHELNPHKW